METTKQHSTLIQAFYCGSLSAVTMPDLWLCSCAETQHSTIRHLKLVKHAAVLPGFRLWYSCGAASEPKKHCQVCLKSIAQSLLSTAFVVCSIAHLVCSKDRLVFFSFFFFFFQECTILQGVHLMFRYISAHGEFYLTQHCKQQCWCHVHQFQCNRSRMKLA